MKTISKKNTLSLEKFQIAKLNNLRNITGGRAENNDEQTEEETTTTLWTTTMTRIDPTISG